MFILKAPEKSGALIKALIKLKTIIFFRFFKIIYLLYFGISMWIKLV